MKATQEEINEEIYTILKCIVHSGDNYTRGVVDLNTVAFLERLSRMLHPETFAVSKELRELNAKYGVGGSIDSDNKRLEP